MPRRMSEIILTPNFRGGKVGVETRSGGYRDCWMRILHNRVINIFFLFITYIFTLYNNSIISQTLEECVRFVRFLTMFCLLSKHNNHTSSSIIYGRHARDKTKSKKIINLFVEVIITKHRKITILRLPKINKTIEVSRILAL